MKYFYIAAHKEENGKFYAFLIKIAENENVLSKLAEKGIKAANICNKKADAEMLVNFWNDTYKKNGNYLVKEGASNA